MAKRNNEQLQLTFKMNTEAGEYNNRFPNQKFFRAFVICESPGIVEGYYLNGKTKTRIKGICKMEPQRQISMLGHNRLDLNFTTPPKGFGFSFDLESHYFKKKVGTTLQLLPNPKFKWHFQKVRTPPHENKKLK